VKIPLFQPYDLPLSKLSRRLAAALARRGLVATVAIVRVDGEPLSADDKGSARGEGAAFDATHAIGDTLDRLVSPDGVPAAGGYRGVVSQALQAGEQEAKGHNDDN
jgi:hypothetical protein